MLTNMFLHNIYFVISLLFFIYLFPYYMVYTIHF